MTAAKEPVIVWFRQDLRLSDNPALLAARDSGAPILPIYILDTETEGEWAPGPASLWWLHHSVSALAGSLEAAGARLWLKRGRADEILAELVREVRASAVYWNRVYEPAAIRRDSQIKTDLKEDGVEVRSFNGALLAEPWEISTKQDTPYKVYTPFWRALKSTVTPSEPAPRVTSIDGYGGAPASETLDDWNLRPTRPDWAGGLRDAWSPGESGATSRLNRFLDKALTGYASNRNCPAIDGTSSLSPHLHFGEISPRQIWQAVEDRVSNGPTREGADSFLSEIGWREFSHNLLYHFPKFPDESFQNKFDGFPWAENEEAFGAWKAGCTGYPIVDAGMRQLWETGWMHNRVRMITASFLIKDLMVHWKRGEAWFWHTLVDADLANNSAGWQWVAGCGADAAPYFRIFNPVSQGEKFDPKGEYVRRWVPELRDLPNSVIHAPWTADKSTLRQASITLGETYPHPLVDHKKARERALEAWNKIKDAA